MAEQTDAKTGTDALPGAVVAPAKEPHPVTVLKAAIGGAYRLIHSDGKAYAVPHPCGDPSSSARDGTPGVAIPFGPVLRRKVVDTANRFKITPPLSGAMADTVLLHLESQAFAGPETRLSLRFHHDPAQGLVFLDLGRDDGAVVAIGPEGWTVGAGVPGVVFRRSHAVRPLPVPVEGGKLDELAPLLALDPSGVEFRALAGWLAGLPFAASVRPGVLLVGEPGSGKSTRLRLLTSVVEPSAPDALGSAFGRNHGDDQVRALHRAVPLWDNLNRVSGDTSDLLCCLVTGTAREGRALYTDSDMHTVPIARPVGLTAVGVPAGLRPDALDRLIVLEVPPVAERLEDAQVQQHFDRAHARLLGALCDTVAAALRWWGHVRAPTEHRMAGHAHVLAALDAATGAGFPSCPAGLLDAYAGLVRQRRQQTAADDTFGAALLALLDENGGTWSGKASELRIAAGRHAQADVNAPGWPGSALKVPVVLRHLRAGLAELGVTWTTTTPKGTTRYTFVKRDG